MQLHNVRREFNQTNIARSAIRIIPDGSTHYVAVNLYKIAEYFNEDILAIKNTHNSQIILDAHIIEPTRHTEIWFREAEDGEFSQAEGKVLIYPPGFLSSKNKAYMRSPYVVCMYEKPHDNLTLEKLIELATPVKIEAIAE